MTPSTGNATSNNDDIAAERSDLLESLTTHRSLLRRTAEGLTDDQARMTSTASTLTIGGIIKHVAATERSWAVFMTGRPMGPDDEEIDWANPDPAVVEAYEQGFVLGADETLAAVIAEYERVATATDRLVEALDLDESYPLPSAPWFPPDSVRSVRRTILHIIAETAQHAGHADIIRESIDGAKTMG